jgi:hypothetical protein
MGKVSQIPAHSRLFCFFNWKIKAVKAVLPRKKHKDGPTLA